MKFILVCANSTDKSNVSKPVIYLKLFLLIERQQQYDDVYRSVVRMVCSSAGKKSRYFLLDQREFLNLSSFESRGKNSSKGEVKRSEEFGCREEEYIHIRDSAAVGLL